MLDLLSELLFAVVGSAFTYWYGKVTRNWRAPDEQGIEVVRQRLKKAGHL